MADPSASANPSFSVTSDGPGQDSVELGPSVGSPSLPASAPVPTRSSSTQRSRSPSSRGDSLQNLLRTGPASSHLTLVGSQTASPGSEGKNSLRRPVEVVPFDTERMQMPSRDDYINAHMNKDPADKVGHALGSLTLDSPQATKPGKPTELTEPTDAEPVPTNYRRPSLIKGGSAGKNNPPLNMRRTSSASSTSTVTNLTRTSSSPSVALAAPERERERTASLSIPLSSSPSSLSISPNPRTHIRAQGSSGSRMAHPTSPRPSSPFKPLSSLPPTASSSTASTNPIPIPGESTPSSGSFSPFAPSSPVPGPNAFLPSQPISRRASNASLGVARRQSFIGLEDSDGDVQDRQMVDSPLTTLPRHGSVEQGLLEATRKLEDEHARTQHLLEQELQPPDGSFAQSTLDLASPGATSASTSLPPAALATGTELPTDQDAWDWPSFMEAYSQGRWDPQKIPNPPRSDDRPPSGPIKLPHRPGSSSAPSSSSSSVAPRAQTPPGTSMVRAPLLSTSSTPKAFQLESKQSPTSFEGLTLPPSRSSSVAGGALPSPSLASVSAQTLAAQGGAPSPKKKPPFTQNSEWAATVRLAGASSSLSPFALPSPEHEHVDPLRAYSLASSDTVIPASASPKTKPRKSRSGQVIGGSWTVSSGGMLPSGGLSTGRLEAIPGTPSTENAPGSSSKEKDEPRQHTFPMATAPLPQTGSDGRKGSKGETDDYFGTANVTSPNASGATWNQTFDELVKKPYSGGPLGSGDSGRTVVGRGVSFNGSPRGSISDDSTCPLSCSPSGRSSSGSSSGPEAQEFLSAPLTPGVRHFTSADQPSPISSAAPSTSSRSSGSSTANPWEQIKKASNVDSRPRTPAEETFRKEGWMPAPFPPNERERRRALYGFSILNTAPDHNFDRISHLAKLVFSTKMVVINLIDLTTQWFKSESGLGGTGGDRASSFCSHVLLQNSDEPVVVCDSWRDWRFKLNPNVTGPPHIRFYAGSPLRTSDGLNIGTLCILDDKPREEFSPRQRHALREFAAIVMREMELWRDKLHLRRRGMIQDSMEKFTRDCVEMDVTPVGMDQAMDEVYQRAAQLIHKTLDVDGALVLDLSSFELVETTTPDGSADFHYKADPYQFDDGVDHEEGDSTPGREKPPTFLARADSFGPIPPIAVLGAAENGPAPESRSKLVSGLEHHKLAQWLREYPDGRIYEKVVPSWFRHMIPTADLAFAMIVPVFNVDRNPFALICAYTSQREFLEGYELKYLRAIGLIILSAALKRRLTLADKAKANFISNISHELRTPLHGILVAGELLADTKLSTQQVSYLDTVQACGNSLIETVNHVLDFTKLSGNSRSKNAAPQPMDLTEVDLVKLIEETVEGCWIGQRARSLLDDQSQIGSFYSPATPASPVAELFHPDNKHGVPTDHVECVIDVGQRKTGWRVKCEKGGIRRVLMNLIGNSLKFTKDGYVQIILRELPRAPGSTAIPLELAVIDTGKGISKDFLKDQLFQPFSQENPLQTGTGLGLAIVNSIVASESVRGKVDVWSSEGLGTEIKVSFSAEPGREASRSDPLFEDGSLGAGVSVSLLGFPNEHRGLKLSADVLETYLEEWGFDIRDEGEPGWADILVVNEDYSIIDLFTSQRNTSRPVLLYASTRGNGPQSQSVAAYIAAGGYASILTKPTGPIKFEAAIKSAVQFIAHGGRRGSNSSSSSSSAGLRSVTRSDSFNSRPRSRTPSEPDYHLPSPSHSVSSSGPAAEITYFSPHNHANGVVGSAAHQLSPTHYLQRRRSEEEREPRRRTKRPGMAPRSITYQPDTASPLGHSDYPLAHLPRRMSGNQQDEEQKPPSSPSSVISMPDGGSVLRSVTVEEEEAREGGAPSRKASCLVVEDNPINRRVLAAFLNKKGFSYIEAVNGQEGVDKFSAQEPNFFDVVLCDLSMPILDGFGATRAIREVEASRNASTSSKSSAKPPRATILALTGLATPEDKRRAFGAGVDGYLVKPVSLKTLDSVFKKLGFGL